MAKLNSYYTLCPLIDQQNLLGVEKDKEPGCATVTLGRNIVIRYKLQDQKQISSWSSNERLTSPVIYDWSEGRYAAVFNERKIRIWSEEESDLNNVKGHKFHSPLHSILTHDDLPPVLVQQNGSTISLKAAIANRKTWISKGILRINEKLVNCQLIHFKGQTSLCCMTKAETYNYIVVKLNPDTFMEDENTIKRIQLRRKSEELVGHVVVQNKNNAFLLTLWSHGRLYSHFLTGSLSDTDASTLISVITNINTKHPVVMAHLDETTLAMYGADITDEGAVFMIYNVQFKLVLAVQKLKIYTSDAKLWKLEDKLLLAANRHLAVAPYQLASQKIAAMVGSSLHFKNAGSKKNADDDVVVVQETTVARWDENQARSKNVPLDGPSPKICKQISAYLNEGWSNATILETLIPSLLESVDVASIHWCLDMFKDLPEKLLVDLLMFSLKNLDNVFAPVQNGTIDDASNASRSSVDVPSSARYNFLNKLLTMSYSSVSLLSHLKASLTFDGALKLLEYLTYKLNERVDSFEDNPQPNDEQLYAWSNMLLDSHYQQCLLSRDKRVLELLDQLKCVLEEHYQFLREIENLRPVLDRTINGKPLRSTSRKYNKFYCIEEMKLY